MGARNLKPMTGSYTPARKTPVMVDANGRDVSPARLGAVAPHDLDSEAAVISALMLEPDRLVEVRDLLAKPAGDSDGSFYSEGHRIVYRAICELVDASKPVDVVTVAGWIRDRGQIQRIGGAAELGRLVDATPSVENVREHAQRVRSLAIQRAAIRFHWQALAAAYGDVGDMQEWREAQLANHQLLVERGARIEATTLREALIASAKASAENDGVVPLLRTGLWAWDSMLGGLHLGKIHALIAETGEGKTALALQLCCDATGVFDAAGALGGT